MLLSVYLFVRVEGGGVVSNGGAFRLSITHRLKFAII